MSFSINSNTSSQQANLYGTQNTQNQDKTLTALSSGSEVTKTANDAASKAISDKLLAMMAGSGQAIENSNESIGMLQTADGAMAGIEDNTQRIRVLTLQASNDTLNDSDRANIQLEIDALSTSSQDIASTTKFNGINLLDGTGGSLNNGTFTTQTGANSGDTSSVQIADARTMVGSVDVTTQEGRDAALSTVDDGLKSIADSRSNIGSAQNALMSNIRNTSVSQINAADAASKLADTDFAKESANFSQESLSAQSGSFAQSQANSRSASLAGLLG